MGYNTASTEWPAFDLPDAVKHLVDTFFSILDNPDRGSGDRLADEIFTSDGVMASHHSSRGTEEIRRSRDNAWKIIKTRRHEISKVYMSSPEDSDLLLFGTVSTDLANRQFVQSGFAARIVVDGAKRDEPKIQLYQVWADSAPILEAMKK